MKWVELVRFAWLQEALMVQACLEAHDIDSDIPEYYMSTINLVMTAQNVRVMVHPEDLEAAKKVLAEPEQSTESPSQAVAAETCPNCGSVMSEQPNRKGWLRWILAASLFLPARRPSCQHVCPVCK